MIQKECDDLSQTSSSGQVNWRTCALVSANWCHPTFQLMSTPMQVGAVRLSNLKSFHDHGLLSVILDGMEDSGSVVMFGIHLVQYGVAYLV